ncbi:Imm63 family immunity protein [Mycobacteroides abscessus]|uniref:Imm63 family immunity protein n=1 Tax=Mycobacteroides abscessus TaxID=36809 RepID=UPI000926C99D|nr:Imm63 family immunity protein [Mycobacteroides abscessus]SHQ95041.1 Uncharacterised protein [Mycobacteroides abscessus subsp. abscessus]SHT24336.1 Uncharacterised protein [Mycobacteroides abscessus subsp. abscessus]SHU57378.1 Uncharacterised protein [Mycobacteroides abscessus subsp. abscessus]SHV38315.1 Uncharacterised protein [Mycobacteroides abscessus subsp. abscessus]SHY01036.1 Uncharacterised protein [Mycobacteroides abscessus subsp. abscessus]
MDDKARALQSEVDRLAVKLGVEPLSVGVIRTNDDYNIFIDENGFYHYAYYERGQLSFDRVGDLDDVLYWYSNSIVFSMASRSTGNRADLFYSEYQMMERLNPGWGKRRVRDTASMFRRNKTPEDIALLPDIGEEL